ncbi:MAG: 30S ribosomal protein S27e [Candidatus Caldarchaeales archaeon]
MARADLERMIPQPPSRFLLVSCMSCGNRQVVFDSAKTVVRCTVCREVLAVPRGGKAKVLGKVTAVLT